MRSLFVSIEIICNEEEQKLTIGSRIKHIRKSLEMTQKGFAESLGIVQGFLSAIEKGKKTPSYTLLIALQHLYKVKPEWIHTGEGKISLSSSNYATSHTENLALIPLFDKLPTDKEEYKYAANIVEKYISLPGIPRNCFAFEYCGDYMLPTIRNGDIIIIDPDKTPASGNIGLIVGKWGEPYLRRYREVKGVQYFSSDNASYAPFQPDASTIILGVVAKIWREINF